MQAKDVPRGLMLHAAFVAQQRFQAWSEGHHWWRGEPASAEPCPPAWYEDPRLDHVPSKLFWHVAGRLTDEDLIDYGVSANRPWLTDKGLAALMAYGRE